MLLQGRKKGKAELPRLREQDSNRDGPGATIDVWCLRLSLLRFPVTIKKEFPWLSAIEKAIWSRV